jgi:mannose-6-phosphate isomerase-like protein (cupin superfamily)
MKETTPRPYVLPDGTGEATWFVGALMVKKAGSDETGGAFDLLDQTVPPGYAPPRHVHRREDEAWYVLEGDATFWCGDRKFDAPRGAFVFLPRGVEHTFLAGREGARLLTLAVPGGFARFVEECGVRAVRLTIPPEEPIDTAKLAETAGRYGIEITGPPPA